MITNMLFGSSMTAIDIIIWLFSMAVIILLLLPVHECAHALAAKLLGDHTAENQGRLTLNPLPHIDPLGALFIVLVGFGWAKPVPVDPRNATRKVTMRAFISLTAAAGPVSNIIMSLIFVIIAKFAALGYNMSDGGNEMLVYLYVASQMIAQTSVYLAVFNLVPIPPLDGSKILFYFLKTNQVFFLERNMHILRIVLLALIVLPYPFNIIGRLIRFISGFIMTGLDYATFFIG